MRKTTKWWMGSVVCLSVLFGVAWGQYRVRLGEPGPVEADLVVGQNVELYFRGDATGAALSANLQLDRLPQQRGTIVRTTDQYLVMNSGGSEYWVPREVILLIRIR